MRLRRFDEQPGDSDSAYFDGEQNSVREAAFPATRMLVPTYKVIQTEQIKNVVFNHLLSAILIEVEHLNGLPKSIFQDIREIN